MRRLLFGSSLSVASVLLASCQASPNAAPSGPVSAMVIEAADRHGVPADLMLAIGDIEGGLRLGWQRKVEAEDAVPVAGVLELRHGAFNSLVRGADLLKRSESELEADLSLGTEAGARVLDDLAGGLDRTQLGNWSGVVEQLSGLRDPIDRREYRARVFHLLKYGGVLKARNGERIQLPAHDEIPVELTLAPPGAHPLGGPDYPSAIYFPTDCSGKCSSTRTGEISMIAIHDTEGGWDASVATLQNDAGKSVHYIVDADGSRVGQFVPESYDAWHVGNSYYNNRMVGIEHVGYAAEDDYQTAMYQTSAALVKDIAARNQVPLDRSHIVAHQEVPNGNAISQSSPPCPDSPSSCCKNDDYGGANNHRDPGINWEWCQYMELVGGTCKCNDTYSHWNCVHDLSMMNRCVDGEVQIQHCADTCTVEPNGVDDQCQALVAVGGAGGTGGSPVTSSQSSSVATGGAGGSAPISAGGKGGAGGAVGDGGAGSSSPDKGCGCELAGDEQTSPGVLLAVAALGLVATRRRRSAS